MPDYSHLWKEEYEQVIALLRQTELEETVKWGTPVFTFNKKNVAGLAGFKEHFALWFYDGVYLEDQPKRLVNASEGKTKALRQLRFTKDEGIDEKLVLYYLKQAVENAKKGIAHTPERNAQAVDIPTLLQDEFARDAVLKQSFMALTPFKRKEYAEYLSDAKQEKTRLSRLEKIKPMILSGKGLNDRYR